MKLRRHHRLLAVAAAMLLGLTACGGDDDAGDTETDTGGGETSTEEMTGGETGGDGTEAGGEAPSGDPINIGLLTSFTGPFTPWGLQVQAGMNLAVEEINADGGVEGRPLAIVEADDQNNPDEGVTALERMVEQDGVVAVGGVISSDVGLASARTAEELETPLFMVKGGAAEILTPDSRYTFRTCLPSAPMTAAPLAQYIEDEGLTKVGAIIADYAWGQSVRSALEEEVGGLDGVELQIEVAPVGEQDFTTYLRSLQEFDPDIIAATGHPPGTGPIMLQATDLGIDVPVTGPYAVLPTVIEGAGDVAYDRYVDYDCADYSSDDYQELAARFAESSDLGFMDDDAVAGYGIVTMVAEAVAEVGDDPAAVAEYLHGNSFDLPGYAFEMGWTEWGELANAAPALSIIRGEAPPEGVNPGADWYPEVLLVPEPLEPYEPQ
jgi:branched-chain amino acid transport system substrate-binding protein